MNREFKFRVWDKAKGNWFDIPNALCFVLNKNSTELVFITDRGPYIIPDTDQPDGGMNRFVIQQFTGVSDDYGNPIYEGDIIKDTWKENHPYGYCPDEEYDREDIFLVKYNDYSFNLKKEYSSQQTLIDQFKRQIIGNIFENPELLK